MPPREVAVARIAARPDSLARQVERTVDRGEALGLENHADATPIRGLPCVAEEPEARHIGDSITFNFLNTSAESPFSVFIQPTARSRAASPLARACGRS